MPYTILVYIHYVFYTWLRRTSFLGDNIDIQWIKAFKWRQITKYFVWTLLNEHFCVRCIIDSERAEMIFLCIIRETLGYFSVTFHKTTKFSYYIYVVKKKQLMYNYGNASNYFTNSVLFWKMENFPLLQLVNASLRYFNNNVRTCRKQKWSVSIDLLFNRWW